RKNVSHDEGNRRQRGQDSRSGRLRRDASGPSERQALAERMHHIYDDKRRACPRTAAPSHPTAQKPRGGDPGGARRNALVTLTAPRPAAGSPTRQPRWGALGRFRSRPPAPSSPNSSRIRSTTSHG